MLASFATDFYSAFSMSYSDVIQKATGGAVSFLIFFVSLGLAYIVIKTLAA